MHSWPKEMHRVEKIPNLHYSQLDLSYGTACVWTTKGRATGGMVTFQIDLLQ